MAKPVPEPCENCGRPIAPHDTGGWAEYFPTPTPGLTMAIRHSPARCREAARSNVIREAEVLEFGISDELAARMKRQIKS